ncbi:MAG: CBS domain-containing protein [Planctomycetes bacterium]|nr:CBS domain-containing protein [Planctomycetota bacterium]
MTQDKKITKIQELVYEMKVGDVMQKNVITVSSQTPMNKLREILRENRISGTPVIDRGKLVGIISLEDFIKWLADREHDCVIGDKMTRDVRTFYDDEPLVQAVSKFERSGFGRFPVINRQDGKPLGIVTKRDIIEGLLKKMEIDYHEEEIHRYRASHIFEDIVADETALLFQYDVMGHDFKRAGESASRLKATLRRLGLHPQVIRRVTIATYEAEMNLIIYTDGGKILVRVEPANILVEVIDSGPGIADVKKVLQPGYSTAPEWVRDLGFGAGMGLNNIQKCADKMDFTSVVGKGTSLKIYISSRNGGASEIKRNS